MDINKLNYFRDKLIDEKKKIVKSLNNIDKEEYGSLDMYYTEASGYDNHPADIGTELFMMEQEKGFKNKLSETLEEIESSLEDIKNGNYGICQNCKENIDEERLELIPHVKNCIECSKDITPTIDSKQFESIDKDYITSFSMNPESNVEFDREDAYQKVAFFNMVPGDPSFSTGDNMGIMDENEGDGVEEVENISQEYYDETLT